jgi:phage shock protein E
MKTGAMVVAIGFLGQFFFGGGGDRGVDIPALVADGALIVDVRTAGEFASGNISGSIHIPYDQILHEIEPYAPEKDRAIIVYCLSGARSGAAKRSLLGAGYTNVVNGGSFRSMRSILSE